VPRIITREEWGAQFGRGNPTAGAKTRFVVHHDGNDRLYEGSTLAAEIAVVLMFERFHASSLTARNPRIAYTFVIAPSGRIFEGTGWGRIGAHTGGLNSGAYAAQHPINGQRTAPTAAALESQHWLREEGVRLGHLTARHTVSGHRDHGTTSCPGDKLYVAAVMASGGVYPPSIPEAVAARPSLRRGKGGVGAPTEITAAIYVLQKRLVELGHMTQAQLETGPGTFGPATDRAARAFQRACGLVEDGIVGIKTWAELGV
jgi:hypothetical protein